MYRLLIPFLLLLPFISPGQRVVETFYDYRWLQVAPEDASFYAVTKRTDSGWYRQIEYIHSNSYYLQGLYQDADGIIAHGWTATYYANGNLRTFGRYQRGRQIGAWVSYYEDGKRQDSSVFIDGNRRFAKSWYPNGVLSDSLVLDEDGNGEAVSWYDNGQITSMGRVAKFKMHSDQWKYYHKNGKLAANVFYNHRMDKIIDSRYYDEEGHERRSLKDREASFPNGSKAWNNYLEKNVILPVGFQLEGARKATVVIHAFIDADGKITSAYVKVPLHPAFDEAVLKTVLASPAWIPAIHHNRRVYDEIDVPFIFIQKHPVN